MQLVPETCSRALEATVLQHFLHRCRKWYPENLRHEKKRLADQIFDMDKRSFADQIFDMSQESFGDEIFDMDQESFGDRIVDM